MAAAMTAAGHLESLEPLLVAWCDFLKQTVDESHDPSTLELTWMTSTLMRQLRERLTELAEEEIERQHDQTLSEFERLDGEVAALEFDLEPTHVRRLDPDDWGLQWLD